LGTVAGFSTFLGPPLVIGDYEDVRRYLRYERSDVGVVFAHVAPGFDPAAVRDSLRKRFPDMDIWTTNEFSSRSRIYWLLRTGAGAALSLAAFLGFSIGLVLVAQTMYAITSENIEEFVTLRALGASSADIRSIVLIQALISGVIGCFAGLIVVEPFAELAQASITWISVPYWIYGLIPLLVFILCVFASRIAVRPALMVDPGRVFRA
jgi:putative ABC transport system permease protein